MRGEQVSDAVLPRRRFALLRFVLMVVGFCGCPGHNDGPDELQGPGQGLDGYSLTFPDLGVQSTETPDWRAARSPEMGASVPDAGPVLDIGGGFSRDGPAAVDAGRGLSDGTNPAVTDDTGPRQRSDSHVVSGPSCSRWRTALPGAARGIAQGADGRLFVAGFKVSDYFVAKLKACGELDLVREQRPTTADQAAAVAVSVHGSDLYVGGWMRPGGANDPQPGLLLRMRQSDLGVIGAARLHGSDARDEIWDVAAAGDRVWLQGTRAYDQSAASRPWAIRANGAADRTCGTALFDEPALGRGLSISHGVVYFTGRVGRQMYVGQRRAQSCGLDPCVPCPASPLYKVGDGSGTAEGRHVLRLGDSLYVAGFSVPDGVGPNESRGMIWRLNANDGSLERSWVWDPTGDFDALFGLASDGNALYAFGGKGRNQTSSGRAVVIKISSTDLVPLQRWELGDRGAYYRGVVDWGRWVAVGGTKTAGYVRACPSTGPCS